MILLGFLVNEQTLCNIHFISQFKEFGEKKRHVIVSDNYNLPVLPNYYLDTLEKLSKANLGFIGTTLLIKKENQFEKIISLNANTANQFDSILATIN
jgi:hypothetical protein